MARVSDLLILPADCPAGVPRLDADVLPPGADRGGGGGDFVSVQGQTVGQFPQDVQLLDQGAELTQCLGSLGSEQVRTGVLQTK